MVTSKSALLTHPEMEFDTVVCKYSWTLRTLLDKHAALKVKTFPVWKMIPWFSCKTEDVKKQHRKLESLWRGTHLPVHRNMYQAQKRLINDLINTSIIK